MKKTTKKIVSIPITLLVLFVGIVLIMNSYVLPWYVSSPEFRMPTLEGRNKIEATNILKHLGLRPILVGPRYDEKVPKDRVIFQRPHSGTMIKEGRRVYLYISGGEPLLKSPTLIGKTFRDAKITIERMGLIVGTVERVQSDFAANTVIGQEPEKDINIKKGSVVNLKVSVGPKVGMVYAPALLGKSLREGKKLLRRNSLRLGTVNYQVSPNMLPNTIIDQIPTEGRLISVGDSVVVWVTKSKDD